MGIFTKTPEPRVIFSGRIAIKPDGTVEYALDSTHETFAEALVIIKALATANANIITQILKSAGVRFEEGTHASARDPEAVSDLA